MIPGSNLLNLALTVIAAQTVTYKKFASRANNAIGLFNTTYETPVQVRGSFQAVPRNLYQQYGLDLQKNYCQFYTPTNIIDVKRDVSGDQITYDGTLYQCVSETKWFKQDGWVGVLVAEVGPAA